MIKRIVKLEFLDGNERAFLEIFERVQMNIKQFEGCQSLELLQHESDPLIFFTVSIWDNNDHLEAYRNSEMFQETWAETKALFSRKAEAWSTKSIAYLE